MKEESEGLGLMRAVKLCNECLMQDVYLHGRCYDCNEFRERLDEYARDAEIEDATIEFEGEV
jgi:predicted ATP-dependent serine protease